MKACAAIDDTIEILYASRINCILCDATLRAQHNKHGKQQDLLKKSLQSALEKDNPNNLKHLLELIERFEDETLEMMCTELKGIYINGLRDGLSLVSFKNNDGGGIKCERVRSTQPKS